MTKPEIHERLVNWALCVRDTARQGISPTGQFLEQLKRNAGQWGYEDETRPRRDLDEADGERVEHAWRKCSQATKDFLRAFYVWKESKSVVCRRLSIRYKPDTIFDLRRYHAEHEIEQHLTAAESIAIVRNTQQPEKKNLTSVRHSPMLRAQLDPAEHREQPSKALPTPLETPKPAT